MEDLFGIGLPEAGVTDLLAAPELDVDLHTGAAALRLPLPTTPGERSSRRWRWSTARPGPTRRSGSAGTCPASRP